MFTVLIFSSTDQRNNTYDKLTNYLRETFKDTSKVIDINIDFIDQLIIFCDNKEFLRNKLKLLNTTKQEIETYPNLTNYLQRNFFEDL